MVETSTYINGPSSFFCKLCRQDGTTNLQNEHYISGNQTSEGNHNSLEILPVYGMGRAPFFVPDNWEAMQQEEPNIEWI